MAMARIYILSLKPGYVVDTSLVMLISRLSRWLRSLCLCVCVCVCVFVSTVVEAVIVLLLHYFRLKRSYKALATLYYTFKYSPSTINYEVSNHVYLGNHKEKGTCTRQVTCLLPLSLFPCRSLTHYACIRQSLTRYMCMC